MNMQISVQTENRIVYSGGQKLHATLYQTAFPPRAVAVLNGATGVEQRYYADFAKWLVKRHNIACLTYDYRDFGASARGPIKDSPVTMADWGVHDQQAARDHLRAAYPDTPLWVIGHSLGGLLLAFQKDLDQIDRVITVASGPVHLSDHPYPYWFAVAAFWFLTAPPLAAFLGYVPGKRMGFGFDLPSGVFWQWRRWCTSRAFFAADIGRTLPVPDWNGIRAAFKLVAMTDDVMVPPAAVWRLMQFYPAARKTQLVIDPAAYDLKSIGHIGAFSARNQAIWEDLIA